jgi:hypothetical protein
MDSQLVQLVQHCNLVAIDSFVIGIHIRGPILDYCPRFFTDVDEFLCSLRSGNAIREVRHGYGCSLPLGK